MRTDLFRNIAIIAHVDHGKTTLVDAMLKQSGIFRENQSVVERVMDNIDLEREKGITIMAKNTAIYYGDYKINIVDTPGHSDFGGEVERTLKLVDGALLLVDASEGPLPQTRFVLKKALELKLPIIVVINKIDRKDARIKEVLDEIYYLFIDLDADEKYLDFPVLYTNAKEGIAKKDLAEPANNLKLLFDEIINYIPSPRGSSENPLQILIAHIDYDDYVGKLSIGRIFNGSITNNEIVAYGHREDELKRGKISTIFTFEGLNKKIINKAFAGDIIALAGLDDISIGDTITDPQSPKILPRIKVDEPTISMIFTVNTSPFAGKEGKYVTSRNLKERLSKEAMHNVSIKVEETESSDSFKVMGRGELQLAILIEMMRREGYAFSVGRPEIVFREIGGKTYEPYEYLVIDCPEEYMGVINQKMGIRRGILLKVVNHEQGRIRMEFRIPSRGLIGFRTEFLTDTRGTGIMHNVFDGYELQTGTIQSRKTGALVADRDGKATTYALYNLQPRGTLFIRENTEVYAGMIVGENSKEVDLYVNVTKEKKLTNIRAAGSDEALRLAPPQIMSLERAIEFIKEDELIDVTPANIRMCKKNPLKIRD
ncbi:MAG: translational GTPase TypA [Proteobacteria bacterium]|nr:translational GTPase TypA [Pseudomonadota bacterium]